MLGQGNLIQREKEREMHPYCLATGVGVLPWSPLARGRLTRDWGDCGTERAGNDAFGSRLHQQAVDSDRTIAATVAGVAQERAIPCAQVALAWVRQQPAVTAPIVGVTTADHLTDAIASLNLVLTDDELNRLTAAYTPRRPDGFA
jgi:aryl-alcohol dehydrogenase-like predicted oxidoreductase